LRRATRDERGLELEEVGMNAWTDAALMQAAGISTVMLGLPGDNFHSPNEWVSIPEVVTTLHVLVGAIDELLR
jgi:acetylornithine deacetylase